MVAVTLTSFPGLGCREKDIKPKTYHLIGIKLYYRISFFNISWNDSGTRRKVKPYPNKQNAPQNLKLRINSLKNFLGMCTIFF